MAHIIDPKTEKEFPTNVEFAAKIQTFKDDVAYIAQCKHCMGHIRGHIKMPGAALQTEQVVNDLVLSTLARRHSCPRKASQWGDKGLLNKIGSDIMAGYDRYKEQHLKDKKTGRA